MNIYISSALDPQASIVTGLTNPLPTRIASLVLDDTPALTIYIVDGSGAYDAASGASGYSCSVYLGAAYDDPVAEADLVRATNSFTGSIALNTQALRDLFAGGSNPITLIFTVQVTDTSSRVRTYAAVPVNVYAATATTTDAATGQGVFYYDGDPNGYVTATGPALCFGSGGSVYRKTTDGTSDNEWTLLIGGAE